MVRKLFSVTISYNITWNTVLANSINCTCDGWSWAPMTTGWGKGESGGVGERGGDGGGIAQ